MKKYQIPCYVLFDLEATAVMLGSFIDRNIGVYINGAISHSDPLILNTYAMAFRHYGEAQVRNQWMMKLPFMGCLPEDQ
jgi:hypothetical protein